MYVNVFILLCHTGATDTADIKGYFIIIYYFI